MPLGKNVVTVRRDTKLPQVFKVLIDNDIKSAPVLKEEDDTYYGFIDMLGKDKRGGMFETD